jgi:hypothetical protein
LNYRYHRNNNPWEVIIFDQFCPSKSDHFWSVFTLKVIIFDQFLPQKVIIFDNFSDHFWSLFLFFLFFFLKWSFLITFPYRYLLYILLYILYLIYISIIHIIYGISIVDNTPLNTPLSTHSTPGYSHPSPPSGNPYQISVPWTAFLFQLLVLMVGRLGCACRNVHSPYARSPKKGIPPLYWVGVSIKGV